MTLRVTLSFVYPLIDIVVEFSVSWTFPHVILLIMNLYPFLNDGLYIAYKIGLTIKKVIKALKYIIGFSRSYKKILDENEWPSNSVNEYNQAGNASFKSNKTKKLNGPLKNSQKH